MKTIKATFSILIISFIAGFLIFNKPIIKYVKKEITHKNESVSYLERNEYSKQENYLFVQIDDDFSINNYQDLLNAFYTILDSGEEEFTFYCSEDYEECIDDINKIVAAEDTESDVIAELNNFVHPYNTYKNIVVTTNSQGKVTIKFEKIYTDEMINDVEAFIDDFIVNNINDDITEFNKIKLFHDYIINNTKYDIERANDVNSEQYKDSPSHTAYGIVKNHIALCGGYSDIMAIYLNKLGIKNIKIAAKLHVWNLVYYEDQWLNLDVTWDDPVTNTGEDLLIREYFLINTDTLFSLDNVEHNFDEIIYIEAKNK